VVEQYWDQFNFLPMPLGFEALVLTLVAHGSVGRAFAKKKSATWRWAFYINLCLVRAPPSGPRFPYPRLTPARVRHLRQYICSYLLRGDPQKATSISRKISQLDFIGISLNIDALIALVLAINFGGTEYRWSDGREIALWVVGGALLAVFAVQ
jgi:hypothetical protein